jgi:hypothetical protein
MTKNEKNKIFKIYRTINALAIGGRDNFMEYKKLVDEIVAKGDYNYFKITLLLRYHIEVSNYRTVNEMKNATWESICFQTITPLQQKLKIFYKQKNVYQNGFDVYSDDPKYLSLTFSGPLTSTYSLSGSQSQISFTYSNDLYINIDNPNTYNIDLKRVEWQSQNGTRSPIDLFDYHSISSGTWSYLTQSSYKTTIPIDHGSDYLITTYARDPYVKETYSFNLSKDNFIGKIEEIDVLTDRETDYYQYISMTYSGPVESATQSYLSFSYYNNVVAMKFTNNPLVTGATGPYLYDIKFQMVKYVNGNPVNLEYYTQIDSGTYSYFMGGGYKIPLVINPFSEFGTSYIVTAKSVNVDETSAQTQTYKIDFYLGDIKQLEEDINIYYRNSDLARKLGKKRTFLKATKRGSTVSSLFMSIDFNVSEEMNLYYRYRNAVNYLIS